MFSYPIWKPKLYPTFDITNNLMIMNILAQVALCTWERMTVYESAHLLTC